MKVAVIGPGVMGKGIAQVFAQSGHTVYLIGSTKSDARAAKESLGKTLLALQKRGKLKNASKVLDAIIPSILDNSMSACQLVIEVVPEKAALKTSVIREASKLCKTGLIATNTSSISVTKLSRSCVDPQRFLGMHFFNPAPVMPLVEVVRGKKTSDGTHKKAVRILKGLGKEAITVKDYPGFVVNNLVIPYLNNAVDLLHKQIASAKDIDKAVKLGLRHPMGPLELADFIGLDVVLDIQKELYLQLGHKYKPSPLLLKMVRENTLGRKTKKGFYTY